jgi:transcription antitermination factor NusG
MNNTKFEVDDSVRIITGQYKGFVATVVEIVSLEPNVQYSLKLALGAVILETQENLTRMTW